MSIYDITWTVTPSISSSALSEDNNSQKLTIESGNLKENTEYKVTVEMIFTEQPKINNKVSMKFDTYSPPKGGEVTIDPSRGYLGETQFYVSLNGYSSPLKDVYYDVYEGYDNDGEWVKGFKLNTA